MKKLLWLVVLGFVACVSLNSYCDDVKYFLELKAKAEQGDADAQLNLGIRYALGQGITKDS